MWGLDWNHLSFYDSLGPYGDSANENWGLPFVDGSNPRTSEDRLGCRITSEKRKVFFLFHAPILSFNDPGFVGQDNYFLPWRI